MLRYADFIPYPLYLRGKVRDVFDLGDALLIVATDRISAFDVVFNELIPDKGILLNRIAAFWFERTGSIVPNHVLSTDPSDYPERLKPFADQLAGRSMLVKKLKMLPVECVVRGYLEGSGLKEYREKGTVSGLVLPAGLRQADQLPEPIFTPSTKESSGHDQPISFAAMQELIGKTLAETVRDKSLMLYSESAAYAKSKGLILADTKFEFGIDSDQLVAADELLTPDSSRFWEASEYQPGRAQNSFDKQYLREWLETLDWDKTPPPPALPQSVIEATAKRYRAACERLTGEKCL